MRRLLLAALLVAGCSAGEPSAPESDAREASIVVTAFAAGTPISTLVVQVTGDGIPDALVFNLVVNDQTGVASGTIKVPPGPTRTFAVTAFDDDGVITHEGEATVDVSPGQNAPLQIKLGPKSGHVPVTVTFGSFSVVVSPLGAEFDLGGFVQLSAQVFDENQDPVPGAVVDWATTAPWVATVDANGLVSPVAPGEATIVATYEGVAGLATVTVLDTPVDNDGDNSFLPEDCDDSDPTRHPGAPEQANGIDDNCDGFVDEGLALDQDEDGFDTNSDCDDTNASINPAAAEVPGNGIDEDCDGVIDG